MEIGLIVQKFVQFPSFTFLLSLYLKIPIFHGNFIKLKRKGRSRVYRRYFTDMIPKLSFLVLQYKEKKRSHFITLMIWIPSSYYINSHSNKSGKTYTVGPKAEVNSVDKTGRDGDDTRYEVHTTKLYLNNRFIRWVWKTYWQVYFLLSCHVLLNRS